MRPPAVDVQAAITVIGRRSKAQRHFESARRNEAKILAENAWLNLAGCYLPRADFAGLDFDGVRLGGSAAPFSNCADVNFAGARLDGAHFEGAWLIEAHFERAWLHRAHLEGASLSQAHLESTFLREAHLEGAFLAQANLQAADLQDAQLAKVNLAHAHLEFARFQGAHLEGALFESTFVEGAFVDGVDLSTTVGLAQEQLESMWGDDKTQLPSTLSRPLNDRWIDQGVGTEPGVSRLNRWFASWNKKVAEIAKRRSDKQGPMNR